MLSLDGPTGGFYVPPHHFDWFSMSAQRFCLPFGSVVAFSFLVLLLLASPTQRAVADTVVAAEEESTSETSTEVPGRRILLIAGKPSHGYGAHEHYAGLRLLADTVLKLCPDVNCDLVRGWPKDSSLIERADTIVIYSDGQKRHEALSHLDTLKQHLGKGGGLMALHYATEMLPGETGDTWKELLGGTFEVHHSVNPHWTAEFKSLPEHPVCRGVAPTAAEDEWYFHLRFSESGKLTPILQAIAPESTMHRRDGAHSGNPAVRKSVAAGDFQTVAWAFEPSFGGRSFGFTGGHHHWNWANDSLRRLVSNAILWTAGVEPPEDEESTPALSPDGLLANQDFKQPRNFSLAKTAETLKLPQLLEAKGQPATAE